MQVWRINSSSSSLPTPQKTKLFRSKLLKTFGSPVPLIDRKSLVFTDDIFAYFS